jgi:hypothetical protein
MNCNVTCGNDVVTDAYNNFHIVLYSVVSGKMIKSGRTCLGSSSDLQILRIS